MRKAHGIILENPEGRDNLGDQNIDGRITINLQCQYGS
jgi:hypothetical protein